MAGIWAHGRSTGDAAARAELQIAVEAQAELQRMRACAADANYQTRRAAVARRLSTPSPEVNHALDAPICPPGQPSALALGDVPVPAVALTAVRGWAELTERGRAAGPGARMWLAPARPPPLIAELATRRWPALGRGDMQNQALSCGCQTMLRIDLRRAASGTSNTPNPSSKAVEGSGTVSTIVRLKST